MGLNDTKILNDKRTTTKISKLLQTSTNSRTLLDRISEVGCRKMKSKIQGPGKDTLEMIVKKLILLLEKKKKVFNKIDNDIASW